MFLISGETHEGGAYTSKKFLNGWSNSKRMSLYLENILRGRGELKKGKPIFRKFSKGWGEPIKGGSYTLKKKLKWLGETQGGRAYS